MGFKWKEIDECAGMKDHVMEEMHRDGKELTR